MGAGEVQRWDGIWDRSRERKREKKREAGTWALKMIDGHHLLFAFGYLARGLVTYYDARTHDGIGNGPSFSSRLERALRLTGGRQCEYWLARWLALQSPAMPASLIPTL